MEGIPQLQCYHCEGPFSFGGQPGLHYSWDMEKVFLMVSYYISCNTLCILRGLLG